MEEIKSLTEEIDRHDYMLAALHHKSAKKSALNILEKYNLDDRIIDTWGSFGKSVIGLKSARKAVDVADKTPSACSLAERKIKSCIYNQLSNKIGATNKIRFGHGVPPTKRTQLK